MNLNWFCGLEALLGFEKDMNDTATIISPPTPNQKQKNL